MSDENDLKHELDAWILSHLRFGQGRVRGATHFRSSRVTGANFIVTRHTFASHLVSKGVPLYVVSKWLGHTSIKTTEAHYADFVPNEAVYDQAAAILEPRAEPAAVIRPPSFATGA